MAQLTFPEGIRVFKPHERAPNSIVANILLNRDELITWLQKQDESVRLDMKLSQKGTYYCSVNDYKPNRGGAEPSVQIPHSMARPSAVEEEINVGDIPF